MLNRFKRLFRGELKQVIVVRSDLKMGTGKIAAQVSHACVAACEKSKYKRSWIGQGMKKSVLKCKSEGELLEISMDAKRAGLPSELITDAGRTQIKAGEKTCVGIGPAPEKEIDKITGHLKLL